MQIVTRLRDALIPTVIADGEAAGLKLTARRADPNFARGTYERPLQAIITANLAPGDVFYDIGANIGFFSLIAARKVGPQGFVYAFEPVPENASAIARSAALNGFNNLKMLPYAVGAADGRATLNLARHIGGATLASAGVPPDLRGQLEVDLVTVDSMIKKHGLRPPSLVKIDVEGAELEALTGMRLTLATHRPCVVYEIDDASRDGFERKAAEIADFMTSAGYSLFPLDTSSVQGEWQIGHVLARPA